MKVEASSDALDATLRDFNSGKRVFGRYTLERVLGRGGMGIVWLARDNELERDVALKFLPELVVLDRGMLVDLKRETKRSLELTHKNIVRIYDFINDETSACISMEYIDGDTLSNLRADRVRRVFETRELTEWMKQLCDVLDYAHNHVRVCHRDLKPSNLMVNQRGELKVTDFGIARSLSDSMSMLTMRTRGPSGTLVYMSPQQLDGEPGSPLDDIYSVGATFYELLTSKPPFYSGNIDRQIHERIPPPMSHRREELEVDGEPIDETWEYLIAACLQKDPARRPQSPSDVMNRLSARSSRKPASRVKNAGRERFQRIGLVTRAARLTIFESGQALWRGATTGLSAGKKLLSGAVHILFTVSKEILFAIAITLIPAALVATCIWYFAIRPPLQKTVKEPASQQQLIVPPPTQTQPQLAKTQATEPQVSQAKSDQSPQPQSAVTKPASTPEIQHPVGMQWLWKGIPRLLTPFASAGNSSSRVSADGVIGILSESFVAVGQTVSLKFRIAGFKSVEIPERIDVDGLEIHQTGSQTAYEMHNETMSSSVTYNYTVLPLEPGTFRIPPQIIRAGDSSLATPELILYVAGATGIARGSAASASPGPFSDIDLWRTPSRTSSGVHWPFAVSNQIISHELDGDWKGKDGGSRWTGTLIIKNGKSATFTAELTEKLPPKSDHWNDIASPYNRSRTIIRKWTTESRTFEATPSGINISWNDWELHLIPDIPRSALPKKTMPAPSKNWGFTRQGSNLVSGKWTFRRAQ